MLIAVLVLATTTIVSAQTRNGHICGEWWCTHDVGWPGYYSCIPTCIHYGGDGSADYNCCDENCINVRCDTIPGGTSPCCISDYSFGDDPCGVYDEGKASFSKNYQCCEAPGLASCSYSATPNPDCTFDIQEMNPYCHLFTAFSESCSSC